MDTIPRETLEQILLRTDRVIPWTKESLSIMDNPYYWIAKTELAIGEELSFKPLDPKLLSEEYDNFPFESKNPDVLRLWIQLGKLGDRNRKNARIAIFLNSGLLRISTKYLELLLDYIDRDLLVRLMRTVVLSNDVDAARILVHHPDITYKNLINHAYKMAIIHGYNGVAEVLRQDPRYNPDYDPSIQESFGIMLTYSK